MGKSMKIVEIQYDIFSRKELAIKERSAKSMKQFNNSKYKLQ